MTTDAPMTREQLAEIYGRLVHAAATGVVDTEAHRDRAALFTLVEHLVVVRDQARAEVADLLAEVERLRAELAEETETRERFATTIQEYSWFAVDLTSDRDRARGIAVALEQQGAAVAEYLKHDLDDDAMFNPYTARVIRESVLGILGEQDGGE